MWYAIYRPGALGGYLDGSALRRRYLEALDRAGSRRLRSHDERHTFATAMIANRAILSAHNSGVARVRVKDRRNSSGVITRVPHL